MNASFGFPANASRVDESMLIDEDLLTEPTFFNESALADVSAYGTPLRAGYLVTESLHVSTHGLFARRLPCNRAFAQTTV